MEKQRLAKYLKGIGRTLEVLGKEVDKEGITDEKLELINKIGSDLLFKGTAIDITQEKGGLNSSQE